MLYLKEKLEKHMSGINSVRKISQVRQSKFLKIKIKYKKGFLKRFKRES